MSLLAEEVVEEWLNRKGYFTIRGIKVGNGEIDILAIKPSNSGNCECRHLEVQASTNPISYITALPREIQKKTGRGPHNARRREPRELRQGVEEWVAKKFSDPTKAALRRTLCNAEWSFELVINRARHLEEVDLIAASGVRIHWLPEIIREMTTRRESVRAAGGSDLLELILTARVEGEIAEPASAKSTPVRCPPSMGQNRNTGAAANEYGRLTAQRVMAFLGTAPLSDQSNECVLKGEHVVIKCARARTNSVGVSYNTLKRLDAIVGAFEQPDDTYRLYRLSPQDFRKNMSPTRSRGPSSGRIGKVARRVFEDRGNLIGTLRL